MSEENQSQEAQSLENQVEESNSDSTVDAISAVALVLLGVCIALYWVVNQG